MKPSSWSQTPSNFTREERQTWKRWLDDPNGAKPGKDIGSRARPVSHGRGSDSVDELYERMVKRGIVKG